MLGLFDVDLCENFAIFAANAKYAKGSLRAQRDAIQDSHKKLVET
jgi:hypothetical protein